MPEKLRSKQKLFFWGKIVVILFSLTSYSNAQNIAAKDSMLSPRKDRVLANRTDSSQGYRKDSVSALRTDLKNTPSTTMQNSTAPNEKTGKYPFHCGDAIGISVAPDTAIFLTGEYAINDEGCIDLPLVGKKQVVYMTQEELVEFINTSFVKYLRYPSVRVQPLIRIELMGGFQKPGLYFVSPHASFWEAIRLAGAPVRDDGIEKLKWKRSGVEIKFDLVSSIEKAQSIQQMGIQSGDQITVTSRPLQTGWDKFRDEILPMISLTFSVLATAATAYITYETYSRGR